MSTRLRPERAQELRTIPIFEGCPDDELVLVDELVDDIEIDAGEVIVHGGSVPKESFVVLAGEATAVLDGGETRAIGVGDTFGALASSAALADATVTAVSAMRLLVLDEERLRSLIDIGGIARRVLDQTAVRLPRP